MKEYLDDLMSHRNHWYIRVSKYKKRMDETHLETKVISQRWGGGVEEDGGGMVPQSAASVARIWAGRSHCVCVCVCVSHQSL